MAGGQERVLRRRIKSVESTKKITRAMELIAASQIVRAQGRIAGSRPYVEGLAEILRETAAGSGGTTRLLGVPESPENVLVLAIVADRGLCGGYNSAVIKAAEELGALLRSQGKEPVVYVIGRKGLGYFTFRHRPVAASWTGFSERPTYADAERATEALLPAFTAGSAGTTPDGIPGIDEIHLVSTHFVSMITQRPQARRMAPMEIEYVDHDPSNEFPPLYEFEPSSDLLLDEMLPKYLKTRIYAALLDAAASESAARRAACKAATDNANDIIRNLSRQANQARQAQITQELTEIVGGADALAATGNEED